MRKLTGSLCGVWPFSELSQTYFDVAVQEVYEYAINMKRAGTPVDNQKQREDMTREGESSEGRKGPLWAPITKAPEIVPQFRRGVVGSEAQLLGCNPSR